MVKFKTHFCLVSGQAAPNLLPLLDDSIKPEKIVLLVTGQMKQKATYLETVIKPKGIKVEQRPLEIFDDFNNMQEQLMALIEGEDASQIALNVTGGTKWMAIAAQEVFRMNDSAVFYVDVDLDKVMFLDKKVPSHNLSQRIKLKEYINAYGYSCDPGEAKGLPSKLSELCTSMVRYVDKWQSAIGDLNLLASRAEEKGLLVINRKEVLSNEDSELNSLLLDCADAGLLEERNDDIRFVDKDARNFCNGGWLEFYVNKLLNELKSEGVIQDVPHLGLNIKRQGDSSHNEIDVCFMARNRLHIIECKTKNMSGKGTAKATTNAIYKLDSISGFGGIASKSMLVSYRNITRKEDKQRAKDLRIKVIDSGKIKNLKTELRDWIKRH